MLRALGVFLSFLVLTGCKSESIPIKAHEAETQPPLAYKESVLNHIKRTYFDPYSIRSALISEPIAYYRVGFGHVWFVCYKLNAKNRYGAYTGLKQSTCSFDGNMLKNCREDSSDFNCGQAKYQPFPEAEELK